MDIPESDEYMTIGGFILHHFQTFPKLNEIVNIDKYEFKIIKNTQTKIELVKTKSKAIEPFFKLNILLFNNFLVFFVLT